MAEVELIHALGDDELINRKLLKEFATSGFGVNNVSETFWNYSNDNYKKTSPHSFKKILTAILF